MAETSIEWTGTPTANGMLPGWTWNPWRGCTKISPGCTNCYAETLSARNPKVLGKWGPNGTRVPAAESYWGLPRSWDRKAKKLGVRLKVFCASLADVMEDRPELHLWRERMWSTIRECGYLDWLMLTKRPENFARFLPWSLGGERAEPWPHVWLGVSVENQAAADERIPLLLGTPATVRFLSVEPLLGPVNLRGSGCNGCFGEGSIYPGEHHPCRFCFDIDWVIVGSESGPRRRPMEQEWAKLLRRQCEVAEVNFFMKQMEIDGRVTGDIAKFPEALRVRQFPQVAQGVSG